MDYLPACFSVAAVRWCQGESFQAHIRFDTSSPSSRILCNLCATHENPFFLSMIWKGCGHACRSSILEKWFNAKTKSTSLTLNSALTCSGLNSSLQLALHELIKVNKDCLCPQLKNNPINVFPVQSRIVPKEINSSRLFKPCLKGRRWTSVERPCVKSNSFCALNVKV